MLHAAFQLLLDFVENENPGQIVDWNADPEQKRAWKEIRSLYRWWTRTRPGRKNPLDQKGLKTPPIRWQKIPGSEAERLVPWDKTKYAAYEAALRKHGRLEKSWHDEDQRNLHRLIEIRPFLWT